MTEVSVCDQCVYGYELVRGSGRDDISQATHVGLYRTKEEAQEYAVPGHPDEWVWLDKDEVWFHGGGNVPGEYFAIIPGVMR